MLAAVAMVHLPLGLHLHHPTAAAPRAAGVRMRLGDGLGPEAIETGRRAAVNVLIAAGITNVLPALVATRQVNTASRDFAATAAEEPPKFQRLQRIQFIAALGDPEATSGTGAETWGLWREDPGPQGVRLGSYQRSLESTGGKAPAGWMFDRNAWWVRRCSELTQPTL